MKEQIVKILKKALKKKEIKLEDDEISQKLEIPPSADFGDYSFPCHFLAEKFKMSPHEIALELRQEIRASKIDFDDIQTKNGYINFFIEKKSIAQEIIWDSINKKEKFGKGKIGKGKKAVVEFSSPNIAKPFGIGHLRSTIIGNSIANILEFQGFKVIKINYLGDWGTQFGKLLFGYKKFGNEDKLEKKGIEHLYNIYVKANKKTYEKKSREWFKKLEQRDKEAVILWRIFNEISLKHFKEIYKKLGIEFDVYSGESKYSKQKEKIKKELQEKNLLKKSRGALIIDLKKYNLDVCLIEKKDGTTLYPTRDIAAAISRHKKYKFDKMIYEVGQEQKFYFKQLFKILELMGYDWAKNCAHIYHGHYLEKDGKKFATRKGKTIFAEDILKETISLAKKQIKERSEKISEEELEKRALNLSVAAIFYNDFKNKRTSNVKFDIEKLLSFEGNTGPYLLYSYARATSILNKSDNKKKFKIPETELNQKEIELIRHLYYFHDSVLDAYNNLNPSIIADYAYNLAKIFNEFYHSCKVIGSEKEPFRLALIESFRQVLKNSLKLLGIKTLIKM